MHASIPIAFVLLLLMCGCTSNGGTRWYAPATWFSHAPASAVDNAERKEDAARDAVIKAAQKASHETAFALAAAPASRPVAVAKETNAEAVALLDQAGGPLDAATVARLRATVSGLLSENASLREAAEKQREAEQRGIAEVSAALAKAEKQSDEAQGKLRAAYDRENALANELRSQRALLWIAGGIAALLAAGWVYAQFALGGIPMAAGKALRELRTTRPDIAAVVTPLFDSYLNRHEQAQIAKHTA